MNLCRICHGWGLPSDTCEQSISTIIHKIVTVHWLFQPIWYLSHRNLIFFLMIYMCHNQWWLLSYDFSGASEDLLLIQCQFLLWNKFPIHEISQDYLSCWVDMVQCLQGNAQFLVIHGLHFWIQHTYHRRFLQSFLVCSLWEKNLWGFSLTSLTWAFSFPRLFLRLRNMTN